MDRANQSTKNVLKRHMNAIPLLTNLVRDAIENRRARDKITKPKFGLMYSYDEVYQNIG